jgi:hypothetical protein
MSLFVERRRPALSPDFLLRVLLAWVMIAALLIVTNLASIIAYRFPDPDDALRLVQVRDLLGGQAWFDLAQHRVDAPGGGVPMHWSRLVDLPVAIVILSLGWLIGQGPAEMVALIGIPILTFGIALLLAGRIAWRLVGDEATGFACLAMALSVPVIEQLRPMRIDHHGWQIVCALAVMNALMARRPIVGGWVAGVVMAVWLSISIEGLPLAAAVCGVTALRWLRDRHDSAWFVGTLQGLAAGSAVLFALTRGMADLSQYCDAISPAHIAAFAVGACGATIMARVEPLPRFAQISGFAIVAGVTFATLQGIAPGCAGDAFASLDPLVRTFWYNGVSEGLPIWHQSPGVALQIAIPPLVALVACLQLAARNGAWLRRWWLDYAIILFAAFVVSLFVARAGAVAGALAAVPLGWRIREWLRSARNLRRPGRRVLVMAGIALALLPAMPLTLLSMARPAQASSGDSPILASSCRIGTSADLLNELPRGEIFAPFDIGPELLLETDHTVVATSHHRGADAMRMTIAAFLGTPDAAHEALKARGTRYVAVCPSLNEPTRYRAAAPTGFMAHLLDGRAPAWLEPVSVPGDGQLNIWRIRD